MLFLHTSMSESYETIEACIQKAIDALATQEKPNIFKILNEFLVLVQQLKAQ